MLYVEIFKNVLKIYNYLIHIIKLKSFYNCIVIFILFYIKNNVKIYKFLK